MQSTIEHNVKNICFDLASRFGNFDELISICMKRKNWIVYSQSPPWHPFSLSYGYPALISCFAEMNHFFPDPKWCSFSNRCVERLIAEMNETGGISNSLFSGYAGICMALDIASQEGFQYSAIHKKLQAHLLKSVQNHEIALLQKKIASGEPVPPRLYDAIQGVVGILSYLLNCPEEAQPLIMQILQTLVSLTQPIRVDGMEVPGWVISPIDLSKDRKTTLGAFDTGVAHGISGVLSVLARAALLGIHVPGQVEAIQRIASWLESQCLEGHFWHLFIHIHKSQELLPAQKEREGWCYGAPGIGFSLFLAACALKDPALYDRAVKVMESVCQRFLAGKNRSCLSMCHGLSGVLTIVHQMFLATQLEIFSHTAEQISKRIVDRYNPEYPFGFRSEAINAKKELILVDNPGLIEGSIGIVLSLLFQLSDRPRPWLPIFLIG